MTDEQKAAAARSLNDNPLFHLLMDEIEATAINGCVNAKVTDHETRAGYAAEARAIRNLRSKLNHLAEEAKAGANRAPA
ncbi:hypothetical protein [Agrobacterium sp. OT33]|uniref:hypothetical protein n=1 Tax=Agrobacterium sp. OT33 TaxID=2815338 RepID=UPI001A8E7E4F|nr:hypothetical protein [Agrobacterium sp. OT33]MBO0125116.1 hypothetical protein [Agrobacterium sp. OT33]